MHKVEKLLVRRACSAISLGQIAANASINAIPSGM
jgi:hypothetical protein